MARKSLLSLEEWPSVQHEASVLGEETIYTLADDLDISLAEGCIPLLVNLTLEDKAAKGLRKHRGGEQREAAIYISALEAVRDNRILLLTGESGSGKTTLAKYLAFGHTSGIFHKESEPISRNEEDEERTEIWNGSKILPVIVTIDNIRTLQDLEAGLASFTLTWANRDSELLLILQDIQKAGREGAQILVSITNTITPIQNIHLLILAQEDAIEGWALPPGVAKLQLLPLLRAQRRNAARKLSLNEDLGSGDAAALPATFVLSLMTKHIGHSPESVLDTWLLQKLPLAQDRENFLQAVYNQWKSPSNKDEANRLLEAAQKWPILSCVAIHDLLVAAYLQTTDIQESLRLFEKDPISTAPIIRSLLRRSSQSTNSQINMIEEILNRNDHDADGELAQRTALLVCEFLDEEDTPIRLITIAKSCLLKIVTAGTLSISYRVRAGRFLSRWGDPRDLTALIQVPEGTSTFGSSSHPNSSPAHQLHQKGFKIGAYPVINRDYRVFVQETGRVWLSADANDPYTQNTPATDLTWHDARSYCQWLTPCWRKSGKIAPNEIVRLPSEPQWERASRGDQRESYAGQIIYPWGTSWSTDAANCEELALNDKCAVGVFPKGRSPFGCYDMSGQVWEWCTTLWGTDMTAPKFQYPWIPADGRENENADNSIRRVLRGGCFSSGEAKATCSYRGSLEPTGFWRGNGFRIVVVPDHEDN